MSLVECRIDFFKNPTRQRGVVTRGRMPDHCHRGPKLLKPSPLLARDRPGGLKGVRCVAILTMT
jgi:hypothetical protein